MLTPRGEGVEGWRAPIVYHGRKRGKEGSIINNCEEMQASHGLPEGDEQGYLRPILSALTLFSTH